MYILSKTKSDAGQYPALETWPGLTAPDGFYWWPDSLDRSQFEQYQGFVTLTVQRNTVVSYEPNQPAFEAWQAEQLPALIEAAVQQANATCDSLIYAGVDVKLADGSTEHFALTLKDQTNIDSMFDAITWGATQYPYHADNGYCMVYQAADIQEIYLACKTFVTYQTSYCNYFKHWLRRATSAAELEAIHYGDPLPEDLAARMQEVLTVAQEQTQVVLARLQQAGEAAAT